MSEDIIRLFELIEKKNKENSYLKNKLNFVESENKALKNSPKVAQVYNPNQDEEKLKKKLQEMLKGAKRRAKRKGRECELDLEFLKNLFLKTNGFCPISKVAFNLNNGTVKENNYMRPSIDRINNDRGYTKDNVRIIAWGINQQKNDMNEDLFNFFVERKVFYNINN